MTIKKLRTLSRMKRKQFADYFGIPYRTLQDWELNNRSCPKYLLDLIEYKLKKEGLMDYYIVSFSGGKDSTAMLLELLRQGARIDEVVCCDTYKEFPAMYEHIAKIRKIVEEKKIKFTMLRSKRSFDEWMFEYEPKRRDPEAFKAKYGEAKGYSWADMRSRWCTSALKTQVIDKYFKQLSKQYNIIQYIGIAADETKRLERKNQKQEAHKHPLVDWGWTEKDCLEYCYSLGYDWGGLYKHFKRVSCWCCPLQSLEDLRKLYEHYPELWQELKDMDNRTWRSFRADYTVEELEKRFEFEKEQLSLG